VAAAFEAVVVVGAVGASVGVIRLIGARRQAAGDRYRVQCKSKANRQRRLAGASPWLLAGASGNGNFAAGGAAKRDKDLPLLQSTRGGSLDALGAAIVRC